MTKKFKQLVWLGAGTANEPKGIIEQAESTLLVEAREDAYKKLVGAFKNKTGVSVKQLVVSPDGGDVSFYQYNLPEFSALNAISGLTQFFPGLGLKQQDSVASKSVIELLSDIKVTGEANVLVIDIADISFSLLQQLESHQLLHCFSQIMLICGTEPLYQGAAGSVELNDYMQRNGFYLTGLDQTDPDLPWLTFVINPLWKNLKQVEQREAEIKKQLEQVQAEYSLVTKSNKTLHEEISAVKVGADKKQAELVACISSKDAELSNTHQKVSVAQQQLADAQKKSSELQDEIDKLKNINSTLSVQLSTSQMLEKQFDEFEKKFTNELQKSLGNNVKQLESFISLNNLLSYGDAPLNYHGWPISADIALYLAKKVVTEPFDYIIEFGSGTSTVVFAKALKMRAAQSEQVQKCKIISFEHNKTYLAKTADDLKMHKVEDFVDLVYAPLIDMVFDGAQHLYYSCESKLAELAQILQGSEAKILVLVDGPPASTCAMARFPAIPLLIKYLAKHQLHIVMDDYVRDEEKKAAARWSKLFEERGIKHEKALLNFEKVGFSWVLNN